MMDKSTLLLYYKRPEIQEAIVRCAADREIGIMYGIGSFGKRPEMLRHPKDVLEFVKQGATSFHASEEIWSNPLNINSNLKRKDLDELRIGWDLVLDIDCPVLDYSRVAADLLIKALKYHNISSISCKFSGNHGFHIAVPFKAFPKQVMDKDTKDLFPESPRFIAEYLQQMIKKPLAESLTKIEDVNTIARKIGKDFKEVVKDNRFDPFTVLDIDTILIASRHLYRMPYSINEKSGLVSVPIALDKVIGFDKDNAKPENVKVNEFVFLNDSDAKENEAKELFIQAYDFSLKKREMEERGNKGNNENKWEDLQEAIPESFFPPCIKSILNGLEDGKKRAIFILMNFLTSVGWNYEQIDKLLEEWNKRNPEPLREVVLKGQMRYHRQHKKRVLPPNCDNQMYYKDFQVCNPDNLCSKIKNPVNYTRRKARYMNKGTKSSAKNIKSLVQEGTTSIQE